MPASTKRNNPQLPGNFSDDVESPVVADFVPELFEFDAGGDVVVVAPDEPELTITPVSADPAAGSVVLFVCSA